MDVAFDPPTVLTAVTAIASPTVPGSELTTPASPASAVGPASPNPSSEQLLSLSAFSEQPPWSQSKPVTVYSPSIPLQADPSDSSSVASCDTTEQSFKSGEVAQQQPSTGLNPTSVIILPASPYPETVSSAVVGASPPTTGARTSGGGIGGYIASVLDPSTYRPSKSGTTAVDAGAAGSVLAEALTASNDGSSQEGGSSSSGSQASATAGQGSGGSEPGIPMTPVYSQAIAANTAGSGGIVTGETQTSQLGETAVTSKTPMSSEATVAVTGSSSAGSLSSSPMDGSGDSQVGTAGEASIDPVTLSSAQAIASAVRSGDATAVASLTPGAGQGSTITGQTLS
jgi:hypothetical protein